ncbi:MAG: glycosyltransferase [Flavobacteriales bacterium]
MITAFLAAVVSLTAVYVLFIFLCLRGFYKKKISLAPFAQPLTVVVAFRNEKNNIGRLIESLQKQTYPAYDILLVDDHSTDLENYSFSPGITVIKNKGNGKKQALITGCEHATSDLVVFTDADCVHSTSWLQSMADPLQDTKNGLVIGGVAPLSMKSFFAFDDLSLSASSVGAASSGLPFACSGASMACRRNDFLEWQPYAENLSQQSGDDVFLMNACLKNRLRVVSVYSPTSLVFHPPAGSLVDFFSQRMRWGQKTGFQSGPSFFIGLLVLFYSMILYAGLALCFINLKAALICVFALTIGAIVNFLFLFLVSRQWKLTPSWALFVPAYIFHLGYIPWVALLGKMIPVQWKGRRVKSRN